jgi:putative phosphoribosyl transferase
MIFANRAEAGRSLAWRLQKYADREDVVVLGIPRGGVPVAFEVAKALNAPMDIFFLRKLGVPGHNELALGAISSGGLRVLDGRVVRALRLSSHDIEMITLKEERELRRCESLYRGDRKPTSLTGKTAILVDDGIATGATFLVGIRALRQSGPAEIVVAIPVAAPEARRRLAPEVDAFVCVAEPEGFRVVGQFYDDFSQVSDEEVISLLRAIQAYEVPRVA